MAKVTAPGLPDRVNVLREYDQGSFYCEMLGSPRKEQAKLPDLWDRLLQYDSSDLRERANEASGELLDLGITFTVYSERDAIDRILPFDIIPRVLTADEWRHLERGVIQRVAALNRFLHDVYHEQHILNDGTVPAELVVENRHLMMRAFPDLTGNVGLRRVSDYGMHLRAALAEVDVRLAQPPQ